MCGEDTSMRGQILELKFYLRGGATAQSYDTGETLTLTQGQLYLSGLVAEC